MVSIATIILFGLLWRLRGIYGWPATWTFAALCAWVLRDYGWFAIGYAVWVAFGELSGWKPKLIWDSRSWINAAARGFLIGGVGAITVPLSTYLHERFGEPKHPSSHYSHRWPDINWEPILKLRRPYIDVWIQKYPFYWVGAWNEFYNGVIFGALLVMTI